MFVPGFKDLHRPSDQGVPEEGVAVFLRNLETIAVVCESRGIQPVLCTFAVCAAKQGGGERYLETVAAMNAGIVELGAVGGIPVLDIAGGLDDRCGLFTDWMHLNDEGSDVHGRRAFEEARRLGLFGLKP
jgi:hypothetical protein